MADLPKTIKMELDQRCLRAVGNLTKAIDNLRQELKISPQTLCQELKVNPLNLKLSESSRTEDSGREKHHSQVWCLNPNGQIMSIYSEAVAADSAERFSKTGGNYFFAELVEREL